MAYVVRDSQGRDVAGDAVLDDALIAEAERYAGTIVDTTTNTVVYVAQTKLGRAPADLDDDLDDEHDDVQGFDSTDAVIAHIEATT